MAAITLTNDQQNALYAFNQFVTDPIESVFVLSGYSGTGKTTLVKTIIEQLPKFLKAAKLIMPSLKHYDLELTATTNKAAEAFSQITGREVKTIHSFLGLRVQTDFLNNTSQLVSSGHKYTKENQLIFIDEASYIDKALLELIFKHTRNCKIVFMGDPAQLTPVKSSSTPVFDANFLGAHLSQVVRQADNNPIQNLSTKFRETVNSGEFFKYTPDGHYIKHMPREEFNQAVIDEFTRPDWKFADSKLLAWTNKRVIEYNHFIQDRVKGDPCFQVGDYAICNNYLVVDKRAIKTDQLVRITQIHPDSFELDVLGNNVTLDHSITTFFPKYLQEKKDRIKIARALDDEVTLQRISKWVDLRSAYACTINKAQGSTYDRVFIDLDDIARCNSGDQIARMLYVAVSRARHQVFLTGDIH